MLSRRHLVVPSIVLLLAGSPLLAASPRLEGVAFTEGDAASIEVAVWQIGPPLTEHPERLWEPVVALTATAAKPFAIDLPKDVTLPVRVELTAEGHVAEALEVVVAEQASLPPAWLRDGVPVTVHVTRGAKPAPEVAVDGSAYPSPGWTGARGYRCHWRQVVARSISNESGAVDAVLPPVASDIELSAIDAEGRWGRLSTLNFRPGDLSLELDAHEVTLRVVDSRSRPVAGVRVAGPGPVAPPVLSDENGLASVWVGPDDWVVAALGDEVLGEVHGHGEPTEPVRLEVRRRRELEVRWGGVPGPVVVATAPGLPPGLNLGPLVSRSSPLRLPRPLSRGALEVFGPQVAPARRTVAQGEREVALRLEPAARVVGRVVRGDQSSPGGVPVWAEVPGWWDVAHGHSPGSAPSSGHRPWLPWAVSGTDGSFDLGDLPAGTVELEARVAALPPARSGKLELAPGVLEEAVLKLEPGARLTARVLDQAGVPLPAARAEVRRSAGARQRLMRVWLDDEDRSEPAAGGVTDSEGLLAIEAAPVGTVDVRFELPGFVSRTLSAVEVPREGADLGDVVLEPGVTVRGSTLDDDRRPVGDAEVAMVRDLQATLTFRPTTRSDDDGRFVLPDLEPRGEIYLRARADGLVPAPPLKVELPADGEVEVAMLPEQVIHGVVVEADGGRPVAGATVSIHRSLSVGGGMAATVAERTTSDEGGLFRVANLSPGECRVIAQHKGYRPASQAVELVPGERTDPVRLELERGTSVSGRVVAPDGDPQAGAAVAAGRASGGSTYFGGDGQASTDSDGRFTLEGQPQGALEVHAWTRDGATGAAEWSPGDGEVEIRLEAAGAIEGRVVDADGDPAANAAVRARAAGGGYWSRQEADAEGRFRIDDAPPGALTVSAFSLAGSRAEETVEVASGETTTVTLAFERGGVVEGRVLGLTSAELERCIVARQPVAADGSFRLEGVPAGRQEITARVLPEGRTRSVAVEVPDDGTAVEVEIDFAGGVTLTGRVTRRGAGLGGVVVSLTPVTLGLSRTTVTEADGAFAIRSLEPGEYRVEARRGAGSVLASEQLLLSDDAEIELEAGGGEVAGWVLSADDRTPVRNASVEAEMAGIPELGRVERTDSGGRFELDDLPAGRLVLEASAEGYSPARQEVVVGDGPSPDVTLLLERELALELVVHRSDGSAPDAVTVQAAQDDVDTAYTSAACEPDGHCRVTTLPAGAYTLLVAQGEEEALTTAVVPGSEVAVRLRPTGILRIVADPAASGLLWRARVTDLTTGLVVPVSSWVGGSPGGWVPVDAGGVGLRLPAGRFRVEGYGPDDETSAEEAEVEPRGETVVQLE